MPYTVKIKGGDSEYRNGEWQNVDLIEDYVDGMSALSIFLLSVSDGDTVTLKFKPNKEGK